MTNTGLFLLTAGVLAILLAIAHNTQNSQTRDRLQVVPLLARLLRRLGRWFWATGEGLEYGYHHSSARTPPARRALRVKGRFNLDLEERP